MKQTEIDAMCFELCERVMNTDEPEKVAAAMVPVLVAMLVDREGLESVLANLRDLIEQIQAAEGN